MRVENKCPKCGENCVRDFDDNYLSHPSVGEDIEIYFCCDSCDHEFTLDAKIVDMSITIDVDMLSAKDA